ncbi:VWA domain-containing protein [Candidatus Gracilibacteria bacterium]|nr:VWA domain-containing protein [Candidatus Gracilibacteria bacterium]
MIQLLWAIRLGIIIVSITLLTQPTLIQLEKVDVSNNSNILLVIDISRSMLVEDIAPDRITATKNTIHTFLSKRTGENIGVIIFSGKPFLSIPFSDDYSGIQNIIDNITPFTIRQELPGLSGTAIGDALLLGIESFSGRENMKNSIILFTDGRANIGIDPRKVINDIVQDNIQVHTIGIGTEKGGVVPGNGVYESTGSTGLDIELMKDIALRTGGKYFHISEAENFETSIEEIESIVHSGNPLEIQEKQTDLSIYLFFILCIFLGIEYFLRRYILRYYRLL